LSGGTAEAATTAAPSWQRIFNSPWFLVLAIFGLAAGPRLLDLAVFVGPDEFSWVGRSSAFLQALLSGDLAKTYQTGHPGVTLLWLETAAAWLRYGVQWVAGSADWNALVNPGNTMAVLGQERQAVALVSAAVVAASAWLVRRIFGSRAAWVAGFLLAFDPFLLTESRALRSEALVTGFNTLVVLSLLLYSKGWRLRTAVLTGVLTGLALLSKASAVSLLPVAAGVIGAAPWVDVGRTRQGRWRTAALALIVWGAALALTILVLWPALWVTPVEVARQLADYVGLRALEGGGGGSHSFFLGEQTESTQLGPWFYPMVLLYRSGPWMWLGLGLLSVFVWRAAGWSRRDKIGMAILAGYLVAYLGLITGTSLKFDRYVIPMLPTLDLLAALGLVAGWRWLSGVRPRLSSLGWLLAMGVLVSQAALALPHHPYYYTYWNPLLGGINGAAQVLTVGAGNEGIDQVAAYLNTLPHAGQLTVASANSQRIKRLFTGKTLPMTNLDGQWYLADYTFIYISQLQRGKHDAAIIQYLKCKPLVYSLVLSGMEYGWLYQGPKAQYWGGDTTLEGRATLHAYDLSATELSAGQTLGVTVYFRNRGQTPGDRFYVRLSDVADYVWADGTVQPRPGFEDALRGAGQVAEGMTALLLPVGMPPGSYVLKMGYENGETGQLIGRFVLPTAGDDITVTLPPAFPPLGALHPPLEANLIVQDELSLAGYDLQPGLSPGGSSWLTLYWQALADITHDYVLNLRLLDGADKEVKYWLGRPVHSSYATNQWRRHQVVQDAWQLDVPAQLRPGVYGLEVVVFDATTQSDVAHSSLGTFIVRPAVSE
jgi:4-amino-4-deoxy-L-arabinose transferase-like glycosyltransferase